MHVPLGGALSPQGSPPFEFVKVCGIRFSIWESFIGFYISCYPISISWHVYFPLEFEFRGKSCVEWEHVGENGISCFLPCILLLYIEWIWTNYCKLSWNFVGAIRTATINYRVSFIDVYLVFPRNFRMVFLPHTNIVILLELYCGTITEPGWPVYHLALCLPGIRCGIIFSFIWYVWRLNENFNKILQRMKCSSI